MQNGLTLFCLIIKSNNYKQQSSCQSSEKDDYHYVTDKDTLKHCQFQILIKLMNL